MTDNFQRVLPMSGIHNFRDYGGYAVTGGGRVVTGKLFRSAQHLEATAEDLAKIESLGLTTVVDLRGGGERRRAPCPRPANFSANVIATDADTSSFAPHEEVAQHGSDAEKMHRRMIEVYREIAFRDELSKLFARYFAALAESDGPSLIHCLAGKDRTGIGVALVHKLLGVHHDDIMADYLLTNTAGNVEARIAAGARGLSAREGNQLSEGAMRVIMSVAQEYLDTAFAAIDARYGGTEAYLRDHLGVDDARAEAIKARLIV